MKNMDNNLNVNKLSDKKKKTDMVMRRRPMMIAAVILIIAAMLCSCGKNVSGSGEGKASDGSEISLEENGSESNITFDRSKAEAAGTKEETVNIKADAAGNVEEVTVSCRLGKLGEGNFVLDKSDLENIRNTGGDQQYESEDDGVILWENLSADTSLSSAAETGKTDTGETADPESEGVNDNNSESKNAETGEGDNASGGKIGSADIKYEGTSIKTPDVGVKIKYFLDGKEMSAEEIAGKSGDVKIKFDYINNLKNNGEKVPCAFLTLAVLPEDTFTDIEVTNGKLTSMEGTQVVIGYAMPELADMLGFSDWEATKDLEIPRDLEITAHTEKFEMSFTATIVTDDLFSSVEDSDLSDMEDMTDGMDELSEASGELVDGTRELSDGANTFGDYLSAYTEGASQVTGGVSKLQSGAETLDSYSADLVDGARTLSTALRGVSDALNGAGSLTDTSVNDSAAGLTSMPDLTALTSALATIISDAQSLSEAVSTLKEQLSGAEENIADTKERVTAALDNLNNAGATIDNLNQLDQALLDELKNNGIDVTALSGYVTDAVSQLSGITFPDMSGIDAATFTDRINDISANVQTLQAGLAALSSYGTDVSGITEQLSQLKENISKLAEGAATLSTGLETYTRGVNEIAGGTAQLSSGTSAIASAGSELVAGYDQLKEGISALKDGFAQFNDEGIKELTDLMGDDLQNVIDNVKALRDSTATMESFSGAADSTDCTTRYIIETKAINAE